MDVIENLEAAIAAVEEARSVPLSASCVLNRGEMLQLLDQIKLSADKASDDLGLLVGKVEAGSGVVKLDGKAITKAGYQHF